MEAIASNRQALAAVPAAVAQAPPASRTYGQILKSSALIGGSTVMRVGLGVVRTKAMALLLGPGGIGLLGIYSSISDLAQSLAGMGINNSGVRQIAEAAGAGEANRIARTVTALRRTALVLGAFGGLLLLACCRPLAWLSFHDYRHAGPVALLGLAVFFATVSSGQMALVQGMRRIRDLAMANVLGAVFGTVFSIVLVWFWKEQGLVPSLTCVAAMGIVTSWWYSRKIQVERVKMNLHDLIGEVSALLKLGLVFMAVGFMTMGAAYLVRVIVVRRLGVEAAGFYQAAWALGGLYVSIILQAMGADFFPRLTAVARDHAECNRLVNEQAEVGLLLAGPGVLGTLTFAPLVIQIFYSTKFGPAVEVLRWLCLGMLLRVTTWPMAFVLLARGERGLYFWTELGSSVVYLGLVWLAVLAEGLNGVGVAFFLLYVFYGVGVYTIVRRLTGFRWSAPNRTVGRLYGALVLAVFVGWYVLPRWASVLTGTSVTVAAGLFSLRTLCKLVPLERLPRLVQRAILVLRLNR